MFVVFVVSQHSDVHEQAITGENNKPRMFDAVVQLLNGARLVVDAVTKDPQLDKRARCRESGREERAASGLIQRIDDENEGWGLADLNLLKVSGV